MSTNPFNSRTRSLIQVVEAQLTLDAGHTQPTELPVPEQPAPPSSQRKFQEFSAFTSEVLEQFRHVTAADRIIKSGKLAREGGRVQEPQGDAKKILEAAQKARGRTDDDLQLPEKGTVARAILDAAASCVNPLHDKVRR